MPPVVTPDQRQGREAACREIVRDVEHGMTVTQARRCCSGASEHCVSAAQARRA
jgi:hypothetical protein